MSDPFGGSDSQTVREALHRLLELIAEQIVQRGWLSPPVAPLPVPSPIRSRVSQLKPTPPLTDLTKPSVTDEENTCP